MIKHLVADEAEFIGSSLKNYLKGRSYCVRIMMTI